MGLRGYWFVMHVIQYLMEGNKGIELEFIFF